MADHDVLVVGAGLAGMRAAIAAYRMGANVAMMSAGFLLFGYQLTGYFVA